MSDNQSNGLITIIIKEKRKIIMKTTHVDIVLNFWLVIMILHGHVLIMQELLERLWFYFMRWHVWQLYKAKLRKQMMN